MHATYLPCTMLRFVGKECSSSAPQNKSLFATESVTEGNGNPTTELLVDHGRDAQDRRLAGPLAKRRCCGDWRGFHRTIGRTDPGKKRRVSRGAGSGDHWLGRQFPQWGNGSHRDEV